MEAGYVTNGTMIFRALMKFSLSKGLYVVALLLVIGFGIYSVRGSQGIPALMKKQQEIKELEQQNADLARQIEQKKAKIKRLQDNPDEQELEIRRQLKLVKPGEKIFNLQDQGK
jgi:cell division protein FtsB